MSHHRDPDVRELLRSLNGLGPDELEDQVGIVIHSDGTVRDVFDNVTYDSVERWAESQTGKQDEHFHHYHDSDH